jgi:hypothetical protein
MKRLWQDPVGRHVAIVVAVKLALLAGLWWAFVADTRQSPDATQVRAAVLRMPAASPDQAQGSGR